MSTRPDRVEPWRWHLDAPDEVAAAARLLTQTRRVVESVSRGNSMGDTLPHGSHVRFRCGQTQPARGDVVVVLVGPTELIMHRLVGKGRGRGRGYLLTAGDNSILCDQPVRSDAVVGVAIEARQAEDWRPIPPYRSPGILVATVRAWVRTLAIGLLAISPRAAILTTAALYAPVSRFRSLVSPLGSGRSTNA